MKKIVFILLIFGSYNSIYSQDTINKTKTIILTDTIYKRITVNVVDTIFKKDTYLVTYDTINTSITKSEYNDLYKELLDQKQKHYDSSLSFLERTSSFFALIITLILGLLGFFGYRSINSIKTDLNSKFENEKESINDRINDKSNILITEKYESEIFEMKEKISSLESFAEDSIESFSVKRNKEKPKLKREIQIPKSNKNPFDRA